MVETEVRAAIADYVAARIAIDDLEERVASATWASAPGSPEAALAAEITATIADLDHHILSPEDVRERLARFAPPWVAGTALIHTGSTSEVTRLVRQAAGWSVVAGTGHEAAFA
jgi:hypothetical protein